MLTGKPQLVSNFLKTNIDFLFKYNGSNTLGASSGIGSVDEITEGFFGLTALTGVPGRGKTTFAIQAMVHTAFVLKKPVLYVSLEVSKDMLIAKIISHLIGVPLKKILKSQMSFEESIAYIRALNEIMNNDMLMILDTAEASFEAIENSISWLKQYSLEHYSLSDEVQVFLDYLNIFYDYGPEGKKENENQHKIAKQMAEFIRLKNKTKANFIIITAKNKQGYKTAELASIKGPNDLEYAFETILSLEDVDEDFPVAQYPSDSETGFKETNTLLVVMKNRWGETSRKIPLYFNGAKQRFSEPKQKRKVA